MNYENILNQRIQDLLLASEVTVQRGLADADGICELETEVASYPFTENSSNAVSRISCLVLPFPMILPSFYRVLCIYHYTYRALGCQDFDIQNRPHPPE